ncbi:hypothetical protein FRX31_035306 [Thalictrum thalictroides]|uniref:Uncharacterized protein n=1 Tax=Thalictrum thalictroides TaxID=46969 RepID=A0A7J6URJ1_THATH|nr:hypothetical protein FRX31_035306 [Thalictrum thalictroides]
MDMPDDEVLKGYDIYFRYMRDRSPYRRCGEMEEIGTFVRVIHRSHNQADVPEPVSKPRISTSRAIGCSFGSEEVHRGRSQHKHTRGQDISWFFYRSPHRPHADESPVGLSPSQLNERLLQLNLRAETLGPRLEVQREGNRAEADGDTSSLFS